jgi:integrase
MVGEWLNCWLEHVVATSARWSTWDAYRRRCELYLIPRIGAIRLSALTAEHIERCYRELGEGGLSPSTIAAVHRVLHRALRVAVQRGRVPRNVAGLVQPPRPRNTEIHPLTVEQARSVLAVAGGSRNSARWTVALALGLRQGEALALRWGDVDLEQRTLRVSQSLGRRSWTHGCGTPCGRRPASCPDRVGGGPVFEAPKSRAGGRIMALPRPLVAALTEHRKAQLAERLAAGSSWDDRDLVFAQANGRPIDRHRDYVTWKSLLKTAGVPRARLHDARHTAATLLLSQGVAARVVMDILGHSQIGLTMNTYSHVMPEMRRNAAAAMERALWADEADHEEALADS